MSPERVPAVRGELEGRLGRSGDIPERSPMRGLPRPAVTAVMVRYVPGMFEHVPQTLMMALLPGPVGVL
jgi:hypothetical protein